MKQIAAWIALVLTVIVAAGSRAKGEDISADHTYTTEHDEHVTVERTTTTVHETTVVHVVKPNYKCAIFVENHADNVDSKKAVALQDLLTGYAAGKGFNIIAQQDVMDAANGNSPNANANNSASNLDAALANDTSALRLARTVGADYVLVCTITSFGTDRQSYRDPSQDIDLVTLKHQMRTTFRLLDIADGGSEIAGVAVATIVDRVDPRNGDTDRQNVIDDLLDADALDMADMLSHDAHSGMIADSGRAAIPSEVTFEIDAKAANLTFPTVSRRDDGSYEVMPTEYHPQVMDATVAVDGVVVGATGSAIKATPGLHKIRIHEPLFEDWDAMVNVYDGQKLPVSLQLNDDGVRQYAELTKLFEHLQSHAILTDAQAKVLEGKATELSHSAIRVDIGNGGRANMDVRDPGTGAIVNTSTTRP